MTNYSVWVPTPAIHKWASMAWHPIRHIKTQVISFTAVYWTNIDNRFCINKGKTNKKWTAKTKYTIKAIKSDKSRSLEAVPAWWVTSETEKLHCYWPPYTQDVFNVTECCTRSDSCQSLMMSVSQSAASSSSAALVSCPSALPARCAHFTASRCRRPPLRSLAVRSHSLITASTLSLLADFVRWLSHTASAQQYKSLLSITDNHLLSVSCPLSSRYW